MFLYALLNIKENFKDLKIGHFKDLNKLIFSKLSLIITYYVLVFHEMLRTSFPLYQHTVHIVALLLVNLSLNENKEIC